ncbi:MAG: histone deacetylase family protein [Methyloligellaceae bacterium]
MSTLLLTHASGLDHEMGQGHPERPDRIRTIEQILANEDFSALVRDEAPQGRESDILRAHPKSHFDSIQDNIPQQGYTFLDGDTVMCPESWQAILHAVGAGTEAVDRVMSGEVNNAFCALRPPGHHAEKERAMGFCFFNNIAVAAYYAREKYNLDRVAIIDFDVHHGNGTQDILWNEPDMFYGSTHEMPLYPGTGAKHETGAGNIFNAPLPNHCDSDTFRETMQEQILQPLKKFGPEFIFISAGFDAHRLDPLSTTELIEADFDWVTRKLMEVSDTTAGGRIVSMLEGGYDLQGLSQSVAVHVKALMEAGTGSGS